MMKRLISAALLLGVLAPTASFADQRSFNRHVRMFDRKEARIDARQAFIQQKLVAGQGNAADLNARLVNLQNHEDQLTAKEDTYKGKHPSR